MPSRRKVLSRRRSAGKSTTRCQVPRRMTSPIQELLHPHLLVKSEDRGLGGDVLIMVIPPLPWSHGKKNNKYLLKGEFCESSHRLHQQ